MSSLLIAHQAEFLNAESVLYRCKPDVSDVYFDKFDRMPRRVLFNYFFFAESLPRHRMKMARFLVTFWLVQHLLREDGAIPFSISRG
jgi:hypothetical protein